MRGARAPRLAPKPAARWAAFALVAGLAACGGPVTVEPVKPLEARPPDSFNGNPLDAGIVALRTGDNALARRAFVRALRVEDQPAIALTGLGTVAMREGFLGQAERHFRQAIELVPASPAAYNNLGVVLFNQGKYNQARQAFRAAFALSSGENFVAEENLALSEQALEATQPTRVQPRETMVLERQGTSEYRLFAVPQTAADLGIGTETGAAAGPGEGGSETPSVVAASEAPPPPGAVAETEPEPDREADAEIENETEPGAETEGQGDRAEGDQE